MRIGIFGGTFNPPHLGHMFLAQAALEEAELSKLIFIPCGNPPHKGRADIADANFRFDMVRLAIGNDKRFDISDIEIKSNAPSYTAKTLEILKSTYKNDTLCFIVGADSLCEMETWYHPELIFEKAEIIAALRGGYNNNDVYKAIKKYEENYNAVITTVKMPEIDISASEIRNRLKNKKSVRYMLCDSVINYINQNNIYGV